MPSPGFRPRPISHCRGRTRSLRTCGLPANSVDEPTAVRLNRCGRSTNDAFAQVRGPRTGGSAQISAQRVRSITDSCGGPAHADPDQCERSDGPRQPSTVDRRREADWRGNADGPTGADIGDMTPASVPSGAKPTAQAGAPSRRTLLRPDSPRRGSGWAETGQPSWGESGQPPRGGPARNPRGE